MRKILLVIDEYQEMVALENLLRRVGFDVLSVGKDILVNDALNGFFPDIVVTSMKGRAVDGVKVSTRIRKLAPPPRVAFVTNAESAANISVEQKLFTDAVIASPLQPIPVIRTIAQLANLDPNPLIGKFQKLSSGRMGDEKVDIVVDGYVDTTSGQESHFVRGGDGTVTEGWDPVKSRGSAATLRTARSDRYEQFLRHNGGSEPVDGILPRDIIAAAIRKLKKQEAADEAAELERIDVERREYVRALFSEGADAAEGGLKKEAGIDRDRGD